MDELPPAARDLIEAARHADDPSDADRARIDAKARARFGAMGLTVLSPPAGLESAPAAPASQTGSTEATAAGQGGVTAAGTATGTVTKVVATAVIAGAVAFGAVRGLQPSAPEPTPGSAAESVTDSAAVSVSGTVTESDSVSGTVTESDSVSVSDSETESDTAIDSAARSGERPGRSRVSRGRPQPAAADARLSAEVALIARVHDALQSGRHGQALRLLRAHREGFREGALAQERRGLRVLALCGAGRRAEARRQRARFLNAAPDSLLAARVRGACASD
jgi:hypothetical protein